MSTLRQRLTALGSAALHTLSSYVQPASSQLPRRPQGGVFVSGVRDDFAFELRRSTIDPARMGTLLKQADVGNTRALFELFSVVEEDAHVHAVLTRRRKAVIHRTLTISPTDETNALATRAVELCERALFGDKGLGQGGIANLREALFDLTDAIGRGFALLQIVWGLDDGLWLPLRLERWPQKDCVLGNPYAPFAQDTDIVRVVTNTEYVRGEDLASGQWVLHVSKARSETLARAALLRSVAWWYLFKRFGARDWTIFCERYGMPLRLGKYPRNANDKERSELLQAIITLGKDGGAVLPDGSAVELVETHLTGQLPYERLAAFCNSEISKAVLGNTLTVEAGDRGARSLGEVHESVQEDTIEDDAQALAETLRRDLLTPIVRFNLGDRAPVPLASFTGDEEDDLESRSKVDEILVRSIGLPLAKRYFYEVYDRPEPADGDELVEPPRAKITANEDIPNQADEGTMIGDDNPPGNGKPNGKRPNVQMNSSNVHQLASIKKKSRAWAR